MVAGIVLGEVSFLFMRIIQAKNPFLISKY